jgi:hypothetical protein
MISMSRASPVVRSLAHEVERPPGGSEATNYDVPMTNFHDLEMTSITGEQVNFDQYKGNLALVVNVASA